MSIISASLLAIDKLHPHPKNAEIYGDSADVELIESVRVHGILTPLLVTNSGIIISGHRRLDAARKARITSIPVAPFGSDNELDIIEALIESNRQRIKTGEQIGREVGEIKGVIAERNRLAQQEAGRQYGENHPRASGNIARSSPEERRTRAKVAKTVGTGQKKAEEAHKVVEVIDQLIEQKRDEEAEKLRSTLNSKSVHSAFVQAHRDGLIPEIPVVEKQAPVPLVLVGEDLTIPKLVTLPVWQSLNAEQRTQVLLRPASKQAQFNWQTSDDIEWARWSWNPITGCKHDCTYCYAREIAEGSRMSEAYPQKFVPTFLPERLQAPSNTKYPKPEEITKEPARKNVFTCSMADLFGRWVPVEWINAVLVAVSKSPQWNFLFLTKFPQRLAEFEFPKNAWIGTTVDAQARVANAERAFEKVRASVKWLSCEPMLEPLKFSRLDLFDWVVVGGASPNSASQTPAFRPPREWVENLERDARSAGCKIYEKTNLLTRTRQFPGQVCTTTVSVPDAFRMGYLQRDLIDPSAYGKEIGDVK